MDNIIYMYDNQHILSGIKINTLQNKIVQEKVCL